MRIVMLSQNEWRHDSRVIREAEALVRLGHEVRVVCRSGYGAEAVHVEEEIAGVHYTAVPRLPTRSGRTLLPVAAAHATVLFFDATQLSRPRRRLQSILSAARLAVLGAFLPVAAGVSVLMRAERRLARVVAWLPFVGEVLVRAKGAVAARLLGAGRRRSRKYLEAVQYLNDFAGACVDVVVDLRPDVIHAHDLITLSAGAIAARRGSARLVYDAHELETHTNYHSLAPITKRWIAHYEAVLAPRCDAVVTVCDSIADWLADEYGINRPVVVMNAPRRRQSSGTRSIKGELQLAGDAPLVVYVGSVTIDRGLEKTVEALKHIPGVHFATVGWRYSETELEMRRLAQEHGVVDRVHFVDPVPSAEVVSFISDADASVIAIQNVCLSYAFCFPNKLLESVFAGLPVAAANLVELRRFLTAHPVGILMDESDPKSIASALGELLDRREDFAPDEAELQAIERVYGWDAQETKLDALYRRLDADTLRLGQPRHSITKLAS